VSLEAALLLAKRAPLLAKFGNVSTGTAGWTDPSLINCKRFYPPGVRTPEQRLRHYASQFSMVEVDATYYSLLDPLLATRWLETTPDSFRFHVKAHASLTGHPIELKRLPRAIRDTLDPAVLSVGRAYAKRMPASVVASMYGAFEEFVMRLHAAKRLAAVLLQFPPWFQATRDGARQIEVLRERFAALPLAVEFRHASWLADSRRERVVSWLTNLGLTYVIVDEPFQAELGGVPPVVALTQPELAVFRFHGQNAAGWRHKASVAERFDYLYNEQELANWVQPIQRVAVSARRVDVVFNNCVQDYAPLNAKSLSWLLQSATT
jgi:uncharacterized protein YecE (DUF72 family)